MAGAVAAQAEAVCYKALYLPLHSHQAGGLDPPEADPPEVHDSVRLLVQQALLGLAHLHQHLCVHKDVKPQNLLLDKAWWAARRSAGVVGCWLHKEKFNSRRLLIRLAWHPGCR